MCFPDPKELFSDIPQGVIFRFCRIPSFSLGSFGQSVDMCLQGQCLYGSQVAPVGGVLCVAPALVRFSHSGELARARHASSLLVNTLPRQVIVIIIVKIIIIFNIFMGVTDYGQNAKQLSEKRKRIQVIFRDQSTSSGLDFTAPGWFRASSWNDLNIYGSCHPNSTRKKPKFQSTCLQNEFNIPS